jgi:RNA polymerase sigma-70 factor (ECF subfamily)
MDKPTGEFARLMSRLREGCPDALEELCDRFGAHIRRAIRRKFHQRLRRHYDSLDFVQDVWASILAVSPAEFTFETEADLVGYLSQVAANKVIDRIRERLQSEKRNIDREEPLRRSANDIVAPDPSASQLAIADERWKQLVEGLTPIERQVVELLHQGHSYAEIGRYLNIHTKVIQRLVRQLVERDEEA